MRKLNALFKDDANLEALTSLSDSLTASKNAWNAVVPAQLARHTEPGVIKHKRLTVYAHNGAIAARLKLLLPTLISGLQKQGLEVTSIRVEVQVQSGTRGNPRKLRTLSAQAAENLDDLAQKLKGSPLGEVLSRLVSRAQK